MRFKLLLILLLPALAHAVPGFYEPWGKDEDLRYTVESPPETTPKRSLAVRTAERIIRFHQNVLSPVDGPRSHFRPSSSSYMMQSMQKHGFVMGFFMGCDRLMRENNDEWVYRKIEEDGKLFKYDPIR
jgi:putative component of membrane protein insertase Oxa1/YidC/SpoIIIJ protein YidD